MRRFERLTSVVLVIQCGASSGDLQPPWFSRRLFRLLAGGSEVCKIPFRDKSSRWGLAAILACFSFALVSTALTAAEGSTVFYLSVYPRNGQPLDAGSSFSAGLENAPLKVISATPFRNRRPIVLVVDPGSYTRAEVRPRIAALAKAFAAHA